VFLNIVLDEAVEEKANGDKVQIGMVVCSSPENCNGWYGTADRAVHDRLFEATPS
jgi:hypothetical protein